MKIIIYCFSFQSFVNLQKNKLTGCSVETENARGENLDHDGHWMFACRCALTSVTDSPRFATAFSGAAVPHTASHVTHLGHWPSHGMVQRFFWFGGCGGFFPFFALLLENENFSSFLKNKLVNKLILFCFYFTQSFIFNPIPFKLHFLFCY